MQVLKKMRSLLPLAMFFFTLSVIIGSPAGVLAGDSSYSSISWGSRAGDSFYCIDILSPDLSEIWVQAAECGENFHQWSPENYVENTLGFSEGLPDGFEFGWKVWSHTGYGGNGFEGRVVVGSSCTGLPYLSTPESIQWGCRGTDLFYCLDIFNVQNQLIHQAAVCGEGVHSFNPSSLNLADGTWSWKIWSQSGYGGAGFEGAFTVGSAQEISYTGSYEGTFWGHYNGSWSLTIDDTGRIYGNGNDNVYGSFEIYGSLTYSGGFSFTTGGTDEGATYSGRIDNTGHVSGSWSSGGYTGDFSGQKLGGTDPSASGRTGDYSYTTGNDPSLSGNCTLVTSMLGGGAVYGTSGDRRITRLTDTEITLLVKSTLSDDWLTLQGKVNGDSFDASLNFNESQSGCTARVSLRATGTFNDSGFTGTMVADVFLDCTGYAADCRISDSYTAVKK